MPKLLLDKEKCLRNIEKMARKAADRELSFRPHCKTHQSIEIAAWFRDFGVKTITVSSFPMAAYFAQADWKDILVAFPFHPGEMENLISLSEKCELSILVDSPAALPFLNHIPRPAGIYLDIDTGYGRTGIKTENTDLMEQIIVKSKANPRLEFRGFYCHAGHSYKSGSSSERDAIHQKAIRDLASLKEHFGIYHPKLLYGDTPNCSMQEEFGELDELTPGNFVFYDLVQWALGACRLDEIAVSMECPVAGRYPSGDRILVHGGAVHFSKESMALHGRSIFGLLVQQSGSGWKEHSREICLASLSQEHGMVEPCGDLIDRVHIGEKLLFLPVHSCLTAHLMRGYLTLDKQTITTLNS